jgi:hypothetical protein
MRMAATLTARSTVTAQRATEKEIDMRHALDIVKPGRGTWIAQCRCGHSYGTFIPSEVSEAKIRAMHRSHKG